MPDKVLAFYIRLSSEDRDLKTNALKNESNSVFNQRRLLQDYYDTHESLHGYKVIVFCDDGVTGTHFDRPKFDELIEMARNQEIHCIMVKDLSRFGRNFLEMGNYLELILPLYGVRFISINDAFDSDDYLGVTGGLELALRNLINNMYSRDLSTKVRSAFRTRNLRGEYWGGNGFYEMTSQWMLWHVNPNWTSDELYHWEAFKTLTHKAFLHVDNIYHSPYVIEDWSMVHGLPLIAELYRKGAIGEDPVNTYKRLNSMDQERFCDEMFDACCHVVNMDYPRVWDQTRKLASDFSSWAHTEDADGWCAVTAGNCPENYGFNVIPLTVPSEGETLKVEFRGEAGKEGFVNQMTKSAGWRYGLVTLDNEGKVSYEDTHSDTEGSFEYTVGSGVSKIWLVVMGAPTSHWMLRDNAESAQWPYSVRFSGTRPA